VACVEHLVQRHPSADVWADLPAGHSERVSVDQR
jgi:hypothetical protein